ncbi:MAG TPA: preprotein translocase subunit YajC [Mycobacteriales bacterium]|nr:preprotein translocase subunit YajC [Mycobacteriales bacterium]
MHIAHLVALLAATTTPAKKQSPAVFFILLLGIGLVFLFMRPGRNRRRQQVDSVRQQVVPGAEVRTNAGLYATVVSVDADYLVLEIAPGVRARFDPRVVVAVVTPVEEVPELPEQEHAAGDPTDPRDEPGPEPAEDHGLPDEPTAGVAPAPELPHGSSDTPEPGSGSTGEKTGDPPPEENPQA